MESRLLANSILDPEGDCWLWLGIRNKTSSIAYGRLNLREPDGRHVKRYAHRVSYETFRGPIPEGYEVDHTCRNGSCINPAHLEAVPPAVNKERRIFKHTAKTTTYLGDSAS